jgi:hypothetical protein
MTAYEKESRFSREFISNIFYENYCFSKFLYVLKCSFALRFKQSNPENDVIVLWYWGDGPSNA